MFPLPRWVDPFQRDPNDRAIPAEVGRGVEGCHPSQSPKHQRRHPTENAFRPSRVKTRTKNRGNARVRAPPLVRGKQE